jgi:2-octaprenyl-6-methoxyphenol hydroxylase
MTLIDDTASLFRPPPAIFNASEIGLDAFGYNIEVDQLVELLEAVAAAQSGLIRFSLAAETFAFEDKRAAVILTDGTRLEAALLVAADGRKSKARASVGITTREWHYHQSAFTTLLEHDVDHRDTSTEFHTREGPFTFVPLPGKRSSLVWLSSPERAKGLFQLDDTALAARIEKQSQSFLGSVRLSGPRGLVPMAGLSVSAIARQRVALVGEAAHAFPPIGAQGLNLGLRDVRDLVRAATPSPDPGSDAVLSAYQRTRSRDIATRTRAVDALNRSLLSPLLPVDFARGLGLLAVSTLKPLRHLVMRKGLGA